MDFEVLVTVSLGDQVEIRNACANGSMPRNAGMDLFREWPLAKAMLIA